MLRRQQHDRDDGCVREKSSCVPSKVNEARHLVCLVEERGKKRGEYLKLTLKEKPSIGKYASENGVASAVLASHTSLYTW